MRLWTKSIIDAPPVDWHFQSGITPPQSHLHHDGIFADILPNPPDLNPQTEYCSATNTVILLTTNAKNLCRRKGRSQELMSFYVFFNLVDHAVVDMLALKMSLTPSPHLHCGRPKIELGAWVGGEREKMKFPFLPRHNYLFFNWILMYWLHHASHLSPLTESVTCWCVAASKESKLVHAASAR